MEDLAAVDVLAALAQETRLRIVRYLISCGDEGAPAGAIAETVGAASSRASFHLAALEKANVISSEKVSRSVIYRANCEHIGSVISFLLNDCCGDNPDIRACCNRDSR